MSGKSVRPYRPQTNGHADVAPGNSRSAPQHAPLRAQLEPASYDEDGPSTVAESEFQALIADMLSRLGEDPGRDGLQRTPLRVAKAWAFLTSGYHAELEEVVNDALFDDDGQEMVIVKDIEFYSMCEHHMLPFYGRAHIAYIPNGKIIGLSKLARITDVFARRLQVQERLTNQIADALMEILDAKGVAVLTDASHFCMMMRGVEKQHSTTIARAMRGAFKEDAQLRSEFMQMAQP